MLTDPVEVMVVVRKSWVPLEGYERGKEVCIIRVLILVRDRGIE